MVTGRTERSEKRFLVAAPIEFNRINENKSAAQKGISINESPSGICFYSPEYLEEESILLINSQGWKKARMANVRWCRFIIPGLNKVGARFI
jgi:hypothetical protein